MTRLQYKPDPATAERLRKLSDGTCLPETERIRIAVRQYLDREERHQPVARWSSCGQICRICSEPIDGKPSVWHQDWSWSHSACVESRG